MELGAEFPGSCLGIGEGELESEVHPKRGREAFPGKTTRSRFVLGVFLLWAELREQSGTRNFLLDKREMSATSTWEKGLLPLGYSRNDILGAVRGLGEPSPAGFKGINLSWTKGGSGGTL